MRLKSVVGNLSGKFAKSRKFEPKKRDIQPEQEICGSRRKLNSKGVMDISSKKICGSREGLSQKSVTDIPVKEFVKIRKI